MRKPFLLPLFLLLIGLGVAVYLNYNALHNYYLERFSPWVVSGEVRDVTNNSPLELAEIKIGDRRTFTTYKGEFSLAGIPKVSGVSLTSPDGFEPYDQPLDCQQATAAASRRVLTCSAFLYPTVETMAVRVETSFVPVSSRELSGDIEGRYRTLWSTLAPASQKLFRDGQYFVDLLVIKDVIQKKLKANSLSFSPLEGGRRDLSDFTDPLTGAFYPKVVEIGMERTLADGRKVVVGDRLVRIDGVWRYLLDFTQADAENYNSLNGWVLKLKD